MTVEEAQEAFFNLYTAVYAESLPTKRAEKLEASIKDLVANPKYNISQTAKLIDQRDGCKVYADSFLKFLHITNFPMKSDLLCFSSSYRRMQDVPKLRYRPAERKCNHCGCNAGFMGNARTDATCPCGVRRARGAARERHKWIQ